MFCGSTGLGKGGCQRIWRLLMGIREVFHFELLGAFSCGSTEEEKTKNSELINGMGKKGTAAK